MQSPNSPSNPPEAHSAPSSSTQAKPPPGWVLGPDGKPCKICTAFRNWKPRTAKAGDASDGRQSSTSSTGTTAAATTAAAASAIAAGQVDSARPENCPPDVEILGRATWTFLHTTAAYYPERPTVTQRANMLSLLRALPTLYPCAHCASDFDERVRAHPPDVSGRSGLSKWLCERHNEVNEKLGKERFECAVGKLDERWKDGPSDGSCD